MDEIAFPYLHPLDFFSAIIMAGKHADLVNGNAEEGPNCIALKTEMFHYLGRFKDVPTGRAQMPYMHAIVRLLAYEVISRNEEHVKMHTKGLEKFVHHNGGLSKLYESALDYYICGYVRAYSAQFATFAVALCTLELRCD